MNQPKTEQPKPEKAKPVSNVKVGPKAILSFDPAQGAQYGHHVCVKNVKSDLAALASGKEVIGSANGSRIVVGLGDLNPVPDIKLVPGDYVYCVTTNGGKGILPSDAVVSPVFKMTYEMIAAIYGPILFKKFSDEERKKFQDDANKPAETAKPVSTASTASAQATAPAATQPTIPVTEQVTHSWAGFVVGLAAALIILGIVGLLIYKQPWKHGASQHTDQLASVLTAPVGTNSINLLARTSPDVSTNSRSSSVSVNSSTMPTSLNSQLSGGIVNTVTIENGGTNCSINITNCTIGSPTINNFIVPAAPVQIKVMNIGGTPEPTPSTTSQQNIQGESLPDSRPLPDQAATEIAMPQGMQVTYAQGHPYVIGDQILWYSWSSSGNYPAVTHYNNNYHEQNYCDKPPGILPAIHGNDTGRGPGGGSSWNPGNRNFGGGNMNQGNQGNYGGHGGNNKGGHNGR